MLCFCFRMLLTALVVALPAGARAALTLTSVAVDVKIQGTNGSDTGFEVTATVIGTEIQAVTITPTTGPAITIPSCTGGTTCTVTGAMNKTTFDQVFPANGQDFKIDLTQVGGTGTITDTVPFKLIVVPSPAISAPVDGSTVDPGPLEVKFTACGSSCILASQGLLLKGATELEEKLDLPASSTSWTPVTALDGNSSFSVRITHATGGTLTPAPSAEGPAGPDPYVFTQSVTHSDQVAFSTGFAAPVGSFCIIVNDDPADALVPTGCTVVDEPAAGILDTSGSCTTSAAGIPVQYGFQLAASGNLSGIADADIDGDGSFETHTDLSGKLKGKDGLLRQKLRARFDAPGSETRFQLRIQEEADLAQGATAPPLAWLVEQTTRGKAAGAKLSESTTTVRTLPCAGSTALTGWKLSFSLTGTDGPTSGTLQLANDVSVALRAKESFDSGSNQSDLKLESEGAERGVRIRVKRLEIDATNRIAAGAVRFRAFGQSGSLILPTPPPTTTTTTTTVPTTTTTTSTTTTTTTTSTTSTTATPG
jgi:hypothetical protein